MELEKAYKHCQEITRKHYENFPVASRLLPSELRPHIAAVYAFARTADDFADEMMDPERLLDWRKQLHACVRGEHDNPIFLALSHTIETFQLPVQWLDDLLTAFQMDLEKNRFETFDDLLGYCRYSANPVGRIILWLFNFRAEHLMKASDAITSALQLTNFWQDISVDLVKDRIYIPLEFLERYQISERQLREQRFSANVGLALSELIEKTNSLFQKGMVIFSDIRGRLRWELKFTVLGGKTVLNKVDRQQNKILETRPVLSKWDWTKIAIRASFNSI